MKCPDHGVEMQVDQTRYGIRYTCKQEGCSVVCWNGSTSRPADAETRSLRHQCHLVFDARWFGKRRNDGYRWLGKLLGLPRSDAHIGMLNKDQCRSLLEALRKEGS